MSYDNHDSDISANLINKIKFVKKKFRKKSSIPKHIKSFDEKTILTKKKENRQSKNLNGSKKNKRLSFKKKSCSRTDQTISNCNSENESRKIQEEIDIDKKTKFCFKRPSKIYEFGDNAEYKFIAFDQEEIPIIQEIATSDSDDDNISISDYDSFTENVTTDEFNYKKYISIWKELEAGAEYDKFPLPVYSNSWNDLNRKSILDFLKRKEILKKERLRWHPDKMKGILALSNLWNLETERKVTNIFQIINELYQSL